MLIIDLIKDFFGRKKLFKDMSFEQAMADLYDDNAGQDKWKRAFEYYAYVIQSGERRFDDVDSCICACLVNYRNVSQNPSIDTAAGNVPYACYSLIRDNATTDPFEGRKALDTLFAAWPELLPKAVAAAKEKGDERGLVFLVCADLFGWNKAAEGERAVWMADLLALDEVKNEGVRLWLQSHV